MRALVLRGAGGKAFVAGTDIRQFTVFESGDDGLEYEATIDRTVGNCLSMENYARLAALLGPAG